MSHPIFKAMALAVPIFGLALPTMAAEVEARALKYTNQGAYTAQFYIRYNLEDGKECLVRPKGFRPLSQSQGESVTFQLTDTMQTYTGAKSCLTPSGDIPVGTEVWGRVVITYGNKESCRKQKKVIYKVSGGTVKYRTKGTTRNNNRCRVSSWP